MEADWTEKYRPASLKQVLGNNKAVTTLLRWAQDWERGVPPKRGVILSGSPGIGKTSAALALANDMEWGVIELNASDVRNAEKINSIVTRGALFETFTDTGEFIRTQDGGRKLIILDEADNLYERVSKSSRGDPNAKDFTDRGGKAAIMKTLRMTMQPIILIVNDLYALTKNTSLKTLCEVVKFQKVRASTIQKALVGIIHKEGLEVEREALEVIATRADGDLRAAINDLQALSKMEGRITVKMTDGMGFRDNVITLRDALSEIFKGTHTDVRKVSWDLDETPESLMTWVDENLPAAYMNPGDLARGYEALSRADIYLGRVRRRQYYRLWAYANDMITAGVALAKKDLYHHYTRYQFPGWIMKMSRTKGIRKSRNELAQKVGTICHTSIKDARAELLSVFQTLFCASEKQDFDFAITMTDKLELTTSEIAYLLGTLEDDPRVVDIQERAGEHRIQRTGFVPSQMGTKKATLAGFDIKKKKVKKKKDEEKTGKKEKNAETGGKKKKEEAKSKDKKDDDVGAKKGSKEESDEEKIEGDGDTKEVMTGDRDSTEKVTDDKNSKSDKDDGPEDGNEKGGESSKNEETADETKTEPEPRPEKAWF